MEMDYKKFMATTYVPRTGFIPVPELAELFMSADDLKILADSKADPEKKAGIKKEAARVAGITVRGLTGVEIAMVQSNAIPDVLELSMKMMSGVVDKLAEGLKEFFPVDAKGEIPMHLAKKYYMLIFGLESPDIPQGERLEFAVFLCRVFPTVFESAIDKINELTGMGQQAAK